MRQQSCDQHVRRQTGCEECRRRKAAYNKRREMEHLNGRRLAVSVDLSRQRLRELQARGYSIRQLSTHSGLPKITIWRICSGETTQWLQLGTFRAIERTWLDLHAFPAVDSDGRAARSAGKHGWVANDDPEPAETVIDVVTVERLMRGQKTPATRDELTEAWRRLTDAGTSVERMAELLGVSSRVLQRWKKKLPTAQRRTA